VLAWFDSQAWKLLRLVSLSNPHHPYFSVDIGSLTGYPVKDTDLDWRDSGKTFEEALQEAFRRTNVDIETFKPKEWIKDINGKSVVVEWNGLGGAEVTVDAPHKYEGPDVFHIGYKSSGKLFQMGKNIVHFGKLSV
jgi:hypothetical protein